MNRILIILSSGILFVLAGCSQADTDSTGSYAMIVVVNNKEYNGTETQLDTSKQLGEKISKIIKKTKANEMPQENNQSNYFPVVSKIYQNYARILPLLNEVKVGGESPPLSGINLSRR